MASGGPRNRSGPKPDPNSLNAQRRAPLRVLPTEPIDQPAPAIPIPDPTPREVALWELAWASPQAWAWIDEPWRWQTVALWVRRTALAESSEANASDINAVIRLADQIGMTPAGLKENGWAIGSAPKAPSQAAAEPRTASARDRLKVVRGDAAA